MNNPIRIPVNLSSDEKLIKVHLEQEFSSLDILSMKITSSEAYSRQCGDFGVVVGRVVLNSGFGVQNAKVSIFVPISEEDKNRPEIFELYPFETVNDTFPNGVRYNLLPRVRNGKNPSHRAVGNFPDVNDLSHYPQYLEILEKYYKYTVTTNESGDFMIFGVPVGQHDIIMDFDLFDTNSFELTANDLVEQVSLNGNIEDLRQLLISNSLDVEERVLNRNKVPNFLYLGNNNFEVEVKANIDEMPNIFHQTKQITVSPFWGDLDLCDIGITRCDFKINFKYTPTAVFFGYLHSASNGFNINPNYKYSISNRRPEIHALDSNLGYETGDLYPLQKLEIVAYRLDDNLNEGSRKRIGVFPGSFYNGVFRITLPMYSDYYITNEFGDLVPTSDTENGIPTKGQYAFEIYDTDERWSGRRVSWGGFASQVLPGIRIPSSNQGDIFLGGWLGTWGGVFEYDILNRNRKFYTIKTSYKKHSLENVLLPGNYVGYFPQFNEFKANNYWNFPLHYDEVSDIEYPEIIGSALIPRFYVEYFGDELKRADKFLSEPLKDAAETFNEPVNDWEMYFGIGVKKEGGKNSGSVYSDLFLASEFINENGVNIFGDNDTWNFGDNTTIVFNASFYAQELAKKPESNANEQGVHKPYNQVSDDYNTYGVFINSVNYGNKESLLEISIYDVTNDLPSLIKNEVYSSYRKNNINNQANFSQLETTNINQSEDIYVVDVTEIQSVLGASISENTYNGKYYYFGMWKGANSLYDIEKNYFIR